MVDLNKLAENGYVEKVPHYNSLFRVFEDPAVTPILKALVEESARPLRAIESDFAADSSGFSASVYDRWYSHKWGREKSKAQWVKAHIMVGVKTNAVTAVEITTPHANDCPQLPGLLKTTQKRFAVKTVAADRAYISHDNLDTIVCAGAFPLIPFKSNHSPNGSYYSASKRARVSNGSRELWRRMYDFFTYHREEFLARYHQRSNVETTFSMIKAKFGTRVRSKTPTAQVNEVLAKGSLSQPLLHRLGHV